MPAASPQRRLAEIDTPIGRLWLEASERGLRSITRGELPPFGGPLDPDALTEPARQLADYFAGSRQTFDLALDLDGRPPFDAAVWRATIAIPYGETRSYSDLAAAVGSPRAARAAGGALARCPLFPVVPCHRVIYADGSIGGWGGDPATKRRFLAWERRTAGRLTGPLRRGSAF